MTRLTDDDINTLLRELPRAEASDGFTTRVLRGLDRPKSSSRSRSWLAWLAPTAAVVLFGLWLAGSAHEREERREAEARLELMRREYLELDAELERLRALASEAEPVLELGGTENVDFVFDLRRFARERGGVRAEPVSMMPH